MTTPVININISVGLTERLYALLEGLRGTAAPAVIPQAGNAEAPAETSGAATAAACAAEAEKNPVVPAEAGPAPVSPEDVRAAMDRARRRIEGEDYKENTAGEEYKKWHRPMTDFFKKIAREISGTTDKPSMLPDDDARRKFIAWSDAIIVNSDGELDMDLPAYE